MSETKTLDAGSTGQPMTDAMGPVERLLRRAGELSGEMITPIAQASEDLGLGMDFNDALHLYRCAFDRLSLNNYAPEAAGFGEDIEAASILEREGRL